jgi:acyl-CoA synthetase (AMP-forming)/AMP-acid ligase II
MIATRAAPLGTDAVDNDRPIRLTGGEWVSSLQIEDLIAQCAGVAEAAVIGVKDDKWGERPLALVKRTPDVNGLSDAVIRNHLKVFADKGIVSKYGIPQKVLFVDSIRRTSVGKVNKKELRVVPFNSFAEYAPEPNPASRNCISADSKIRKRNKSNWLQSP